MTTAVTVPALPESVADATLVNWNKKPGDSVREGENLVDLETDKVVLEMPAPVSGVLKEITAQDGATVTGGDIIAYIEEGAVAAAPAAAAPSAEKAAAPAAAAANADDKALSPAARKIAAEAGVAAGEVAGSGRGGRETKNDVKQPPPGRARTDDPPA